MFVREEEMNSIIKKYEVILRDLFWVMSPNIWFRLPHDYRVGTNQIVSAY